MLRFPQFEIVFLSKQLQYVPRLAKAPAFLQALVQGEGGDEWRSRLVKSLGVLRALVAPRFNDLPDPAVDPASWETFWRRWPAVWKGAIRLMLKVAGEDPHRANEATAWKLRIRQPTQMMRNAYV